MKNYYLKKLQLTLLLLVFFLLSGCNRQSDTAKPKEEKPAMPNGPILTKHIEPMEEMRNAEKEMYHFCDSHISFNADGEFTHADVRLYLLQKEEKEEYYFHEWMLSCDPNSTNYVECTNKNLHVPKSDFFENGETFKTFAERFDSIDWNSFLSENKVGSPIRYEIYTSPGIISPEFIFYLDEHASEIQWYTLEDGKITSSKQDHYSSQEGELIFTIIPSYSETEAPGEYKNIMILKLPSEG